MDIVMQESDLPGSPKSPDELAALGWRYVDTPGWSSQEGWDRFLSVMGETEFKMLAMSRMETRGIRGQFLISPKGLQNLKEHAEATKARQAGGMN